MASDNNNARPKINWKQIFQDGMKVYDIAINCDSLVDLSRGWSVYVGEKIDPQKEEEGRVVSVIGDFKAGKTFFLGRLSRTNLGANACVPTLGISMKYIAPEEPDPEEPVKDFVVLDIAGGEVPVYPDEKAMSNQIAVEQLVRRFALEISGACIYLTSKFTRQTQIQIQEILTSQKTGLGGKFTESNKLIVIHNLKDHTTTPEEIKMRVDRAVTELYEVHRTPMPGGTLPPDVPVASAEYKLKKQVIEIGPRMRAECYQTTYVRHYFLVNDGSEAGKEFNDRTIQALRTLLMGAIQPRGFGLVKEFCSWMPEHLYTCLVNLPKEFALDFDEGKDEGGAQVCDPSIRIVDKSSNQYYQEKLDLPRLTFLMGGEILTSQLLHGYVKETNLGYKMYVDAAGLPSALAEQNIELADFLTETGHTIIKIYVTIPSVELLEDGEKWKEENKEVTADPNKRPFYFYRFSPKVRLLPFGMKDLKVENGKIILTLRKMYPDDDKKKK